jgi:N-acetylneuraminic acid mutarotase
MSGSSTVGSNYGQPAVYGKLGVPAAGNTPGGRSDAITWSDAGGRLWLFGGTTLTPGGEPLFLNDLWMFDDSSNEWTWMSGSNAPPCPSVCGQPGVYGTLGTPAVGNVPGGREDTVSWIDKTGNLWLYGGEGIDASGHLGTLDDLWMFNTSTGIWTWMGGSTGLLPTGQGQLPVYGTLGLPAAGNIPGGRYAATAWTDSSGFFWLLGGVGFYSTSEDTTSVFNDLWRFDPATNEWTWMGGSNTPGTSCFYGSCTQPGVFGTLGTPAPGNIPGSRYSAVTWTDQSGHLWLFGGADPINDGLNDLWEYYPSLNQWAWMGGGSAIIQPGVFGTLGTLASGNYPGGRFGAAGWTDSNGLFWLFGGAGVDTSGNPGSMLDDLWVLDPSSNLWAWMGGNSTIGLANPGVYGTLGISAPGNIPGGRLDFEAWRDKSGNFWLFGGYGADVDGEAGYLNDVWQYGPAAPVFPVAATPAFSSPGGTYPTPLTVTISDKTPDAVIYYTTDGTTPTSESTVYNNAIAVSASETLKAIATAAGYDNSPVATAAYTITSPAAATPTFSIPAGTYNSPQTVTISDKTPDAVIHYTTDGATPTAGSTVYSTAITVSTSETLKAIATATGYSPSQVASSAYTITASASGIGEWTWMGGSSTVPIDSYQPGVYGTLGTPAAGNIPGGRNYATSWTDKNGNFWLLGGTITVQNGSPAAAYDFAYLNDLWEFNPSTNEWAWMGGSSTLSSNCVQFSKPSNETFCGQAGVYGSLNTPAAGNLPGSRENAAAWTDSNGNLWLFGGDGFDASGHYGFLNDLWVFSPSSNKWAWMGGSNILSNPDASVNGQPGVYGTLGKPASGNYPGSRNGASSWIDSSGNLWLFGGLAFDAQDYAGYLNDLWEFNPSTNEWTWMSGSDSVNLTEEFGTLGTFAPGNVPIGLQNAASWSDSSGNFWLFGGYGLLDTSGGNATGPVNELWEFDPAKSEWAWMGGADTFLNGNTYWPGVYGTLGTPATGNLPGSRFDVAYWTDTSGNFWLFGGFGSNANQGTAGELNDLWEFIPSTSEWTWMDGSSTYIEVPGVYGTLGVPAPANTPGGRFAPSMWTDLNGNLWLFGGMGTDSQGGGGYLNDLWEYSATTPVFPPAATPTFSAQNPSPTYALTVTISDMTSGATIYYTTDGTKPTTGSAIYNGPITVSSSETLEAIATASNYSTSAVASATYLQTATPTINPPGGTYTSAQTVTISDSMPGAIILCTFSNQSPAPCDGPQTVSQSATLTATAVVPGYAISAAASATYTITPPAATPTFSSQNPAPTFALTVTISDTISDATIYYTTNGTTPTTSSAIYTGPITVSSSETLEAIATASNYSTSAVASATYLQTATPTFNPPGGTYTSAQTVTISDSMPGATILCSFSNQSPAPCNGPQAVSQSATLTATAVVPGYAVSAAASATYTIMPPTATPTFSPMAGTYSTDQTVVITDATSGATIYYTTDGTTPTTSSTVYGGPIGVASSETIEAIATASNYSPSAVATATYTIPPDFTFSLNPASIVVQAGQSGTSTITVTEVGAFDVANVSWACSGLPARAACNFNIEALPTNPVTSFVKMTVTTSSSAATSDRGRSLIIPGSALAVAFCFLGIKKRRRIAMLLLLTVSGLGLSLLSGCTATLIFNDRPVTSTVTVTGTSGSLQHTETFLLTVN